MSVQGWKNCKLEDIAEYKTGKLNSNAAKANGAYPFFTCSPETLKINSYAFDCEAAILAGNNANGIFCLKYYNGKFNAYQRTYIITTDPSVVDIKFLFYQLDLQLNRLQSISHGTATKYLTIPLLNEIEVNLPSIATQIRIAAILSALDDKIELNRRTNATLEAIAQAIFKEWFVDFRFSGATGEMQDSELGPIPRGWKIGRLGNVIEIKGGTTPSTKNPDYWDGEYYWATPRDLSGLQSPVLLSTERKITQKGLQQISSGMLPKGTLLLSSRAPIGYLAISQIPVSINQGYIAIQGTLLSNLFMLFWLKQNMGAVKERANGSTFQEISKSNFREIELIMPEENLLRNFEILIAPLFESIVKNEIENISITKTRDTLLPKLMSGEIEV